MSTSPNALNWFEIPTLDFNRAQTFYAAVLGRPVASMAMGPGTMGMLSSDQQGVGGAIVHGAGMVPSQQGTMVYLNVGDDLAVMLARVEGAGGKIAVPKTQTTCRMPTRAPAYN